MILMINMTLTENSKRTFLEIRGFWVLIAQLTEMKVSCHQIDMFPRFH